MYINSEDKRLFNIQMLMYGYKEFDTDYFESNDYKSLRGVILDCLAYKHIGDASYKILHKSDILSFGRYVIDRHFGDCDLRVRFTNGNEFLSKLVAIFGLHPKEEDYADIIDYINNQVDLFRVTDVPVNLDIFSDYSGLVRDTCFFNMNDMKDEYFKRLPVCIFSIDLGGSLDDECKNIYVHEMAHALINRNKGSIRNMLNHEAFSIFMERVAARDNDFSILDWEILKRLLMVKNDILNMEYEKFNGGDYMKIFAAKKYIISTIYATALFDTYHRGSNKLRKEIDTSLGKVITGDDILENVFERYEANLDRGSKIMKRQLRYYQKRC